MLRTDLIRPLPELLRGQAAALGDKTAFDDGRRTVSYRDLEARTRRLAGHLAQLRVQPGDRVALLLGDRVETVESYFAVARAGAVGVPLSPAVSDDELAWLLHDSGAALVITEPGHVRRLGALGTSAPAIVLVGGGGPDSTGLPSYETLATTEPATLPRDDLALDDIAWILYTAGTTGRPKGVQSTQRNCLWSVAAAYVPALGLGVGDRIVWSVPLSHSLSHIACVLAVTAVGAQARIVGTPPAGELLRILREERATVLAGVPTMYHYLVREARNGGPAPSHLRVGLVGGSGTAAPLRRAVEGLFGMPLLDAYGSTETCGAIAIEWPTGGRVEGSCGLPVPGLAVRLVDPRTRHDVPDGEEGEVWVRGPNVMAGYHNQPRATAAALDGGWYRTGDLARRDLSGYLTLTGRATELIIRAGENIHPVQIEDVLRTVPGVADAAVVGRPHEALGEVPVAFVVPVPGAFDPAGAYAVCRRRLPPDKVPEDLYEIAAVPRTAGGKMVRGKLLELPSRLRAVADTHHASLFRVDWVPCSTHHGPALADWAVAGDDAARYAAALRAGGVRASAHEDLTAVLTAASRGEPLPEAVLLTPPSTPPRTTGRASFGRAAERTLAAYTELLRTWPTDGPLADRPLVVATRGAVSTGAGDPAGPLTDLAGAGPLAQAPLWGLLRSLQVEQPGRFAIADLDDAAAAGAVPAAVGSGKHQFAVRSGVTLIPLLNRAPTEPADRQDLAFDTRGTVVVTGADTVRGAAVAHHLVAAHGVRELLLITDTGREGLAAESRRSLAGAGADVRLVECHLANRAAVNRALEKAGSPLRGVVHAWQPEGRTVTDALATAAAGVRNLSDLTWQADLTAFVMFSAASGTLGAAGRTQEAVCAGFLDAFARHLRSAGLPALSIGWGPWEADTADGTAALSDRQALAAFDAALTVADAHLVAMRLDAATTPDPVPAPLRGLVDGARRPTEPTNSPRPRGTEPAWW